ncbi:Acriflavine resistance protein AcrB [Helicobacter sp. NHP21005]|uniref:efflux RND transporter permease subunit n=1 Tax=Helicobacter felistomachi TaxID=3040201 RepID=UPI002572512D|nr:efflux RND transporter permease subunit [Helicobacter sp. NHP21005]BEG56882.1 Acriflavine resistance protein AcrB [Helicobacter sp. NHP21005]
MYKFAIQRPITTLMFACMIVFFGTMALKKISVALFPNIDFPIIVVKTAYPGASADIVESKVTDKIEEAVMSVDGIKKVTSNSARNVSIVVVEFVLEKPIMTALNDIINKVSSVSFNDPNIRRPSIDKVDTSGQAILSIFLASKTKTPAELNDHAKNIIKPMLQKVEGVGNVQLQGYEEKQIRIYADPSLMNKYGLTYNDLYNTLKTQNLEMDGGKIISPKKNYAILVDGNSYTLQELGDIQIGNHVRLRDIATIEKGIDPDITYASYGHDQGIVLEVQKIAGANEIKIVDAIYKELDAMRAVSPGYELRPFLDTTDYTRHSIKDVRFDLILGGILAVSVVFVFLRSFSITFVSAMSIPISIMGTFALIKWIGFSLNMMTMVALTLSIGIIIDDAIVVIENIHKKLEAGMDKRTASYEGVHEIAFAIIAISAMLLSVFIPVGNMSGVVGRWFQSFGITVALAITISYFVVVTVVPMLSSLIVSPEQSALYKRTEPFFQKMEKSYAKLLGWLLNHKLLVGLVVAGIFAASLHVAGKLGMEFLLKEDRGKFYVYVKAQTDISLKAMLAKMKALQAVIEKDPDVEFDSMQVGYGNIQSTFKGKFYVKLKKDHKKNQFVIMEEMRQKLRAIPEAKDLQSINLAEVPLVGGGDSSAFQVFVYAPTQKLVDASVAKLRHFLLESPEMKGKVAGYHTNTSDYQTQYQLRILRAATVKYGVTAQDIANVVSNAFSGENRVSYFKEAGKEYDIIIRVPPDKKMSLDDIKRLQIKNKSGKLMFLDGLIEVVERKVASNITRYNRQRSVTVLARPAKGASLGELLSQVEKHKDQWLAKGAAFRFTGESDRLKESNQAFGVAIVTAFILIYMILAALYESLLEPLIIMVTMPLSFSGAFFALGMVHQSMSLFSLMGLILLIGMVGKNATLIIDIANDRRKEGHSIEEAIVLAGESRLRPILMTTIAMVCGMLPLAIAVGQGSAMKSPIGIAMSGGLLVSMALSLLVVPIFYRLLAPLDDKLKKFYQGNR